MRLSRARSPSFRVASRGLCGLSPCAASTQTIQSGRPWPCEVAATMVCRAARSPTAVASSSRTMGRSRWSAERLLPMQADLVVQLCAPCFPHRHCCQRGAPTTRERVNACSCKHPSQAPISCERAGVLPPPPPPWHTSPPERSRVPSMRLFSALRTCLRCCVGCARRTHERHGSASGAATTMCSESHFASEAGW